VSLVPNMVRIKQHLPRPVIQDVEQAVIRELDEAGVGRRITKGSVIAITAGSRGIANIDVILHRTACYVKERGGLPEIISAMGSHGGGTPEGQRDILTSLGITEENMGCLISSSSEVVELGHTPTHGVPVYCAREAVKADGVIVINRVKAHTAFIAPRESGLTKMLGIGLGRAPGAQAIHSHGPGEIGQIILELSRVVREKINILVGLAIVENGYEETALIKGILPKSFEAEEEKLLKYAKELMARIPFDDLDLLIVDEMGKDYSGTGIDTNVIGRWRIHGVPEPERPRYSRIAILDLSERSHGNATGIGLADFTTKRLRDKIDYQATYLNCLTSGFIQRAMIPITLDSDQEVIEKAVNSLNLPEDCTPRIVRIKNTLHLDEMYCSDNLIPEIKNKPCLEVMSGSYHLSFDEKSNLLRG